ncbi:MAG: DUF6765 family protein [Planctomycetota bacterium]|jgi:hypothetical protein
MERDYHYYTVYQLARLADFKLSDAETIAYASQYVDDSTESNPVEPFPDQHFDTARTAHYGLKAFNWNVQKKIYMPFHFLPMKIRWEYPEDFSYVTKPATGNDTELATMLIKDALTETNRRFKLIRLGIALHTIADTFSHFGFSGRHHDENDVGKIWYAKRAGGWDFQTIKSYADVFVPRIGHVEAFESPDLPFLKWRYTNNSNKKSTRSNFIYCMNGVKLIYSFLKTAKASSITSADLAHDHPKELKKIQSLFKRTGSRESRCKRWKKYTDAPDYDKKKWRRGALKGNVDWDDMSRTRQKIHIKRLKGKAGFDTSKWAYFHRAAFKQRSLVVGWLN